MTVNNHAMTIDFLTPPPSPRTDMRREPIPPSDCSLRGVLVIIYDY
jgi:hypothetical protein